MSIKRFAEKINLEFYKFLEFIFLILNFLMSFKMFFKGKLSKFKFIRISFFSPSNPSKVNQRGFVELKYEWQNFNDKLHKWRTRQVNGKKSGHGRFWCTVVRYEKTFLVGRWKNSGKIFQRSISRKTFQSKFLQLGYLKKIIRTKFRRSHVLT